MYQTYNPGINSKSCYIVLLREPYFNLEELYYVHKNGDTRDLRSEIFTHKSFDNSQYMFCNYQLGVFIDKIINKYIVNNTTTEFYHTR